MHEARKIGAKLLNIKSIILLTTGLPCALHNDSQFLEFIQRIIRFAILVFRIDYFLEAKNQIRMRKLRELIASDSASALTAQLECNFLV